MPEVEQDRLTDSPIDTCTLSLYRLQSTQCSAEYNQCPVVPTSMLESVMFQSLACWGASVSVGRSQTWGLATATDLLQRGRG